MTAVTASPFVARRQTLLKHLARLAPAGGVAIIPAAPEVTRSRDTEYPFRQDSDFYYLTGFNEPNAVLVLTTDSDIPVQLFCQPSDAQAEVWHGRRLGLTAAAEQLHIDVTWSIDELNKRLPQLLNHVDTVFYAQGTYADFDQRLFGYFNELRQSPKRGLQAPRALVDLRPVLHAQRLIKQPDEIALMRKAAEISVAAHKRAMRFAKPGRYEYQVAAEIHHEFAMHGALHPAYGTICGGGENACILHYTENSDVLRDGDLLLIDAGAEYQGYAADITRTFPVNGRFSPEQRDLYNLVLAAQLAALDCVKPGGSLPAASEAAAKVITKGLLELGIITGSFDEHWDKVTYRNFFIHGLGHWLGLDVHDVGAYTENDKPVTFKPGMVLTIEPGIYIPGTFGSDDGKDAVKIDERWHGLGIRIEDDVLVTKTGHENLTAAVPKTVAEIEAWLTEK